MDAGSQDKISEWVDMLSDSKCLSENDMKELCDIVCFFFLFSFFFSSFLCLFSSLFSRFFFFFCLTSFVFSAQTIAL